MELLPRRAFDLVTRYSAGGRVTSATSPGRSRPSTRRHDDLDFSHCNNTPEHADRGDPRACATPGSARLRLRLLRAPRAEPHFTSHDMRLDDSRRVQRDLEGLPGGPADDGRVFDGAGTDPFEQTRRD